MFDVLEDTAKVSLFREFFNNVMICRELRTEEVIRHSTKASVSKALSVTVLM